MCEISFMTYFCILHKTIHLYKKIHTKFNFIDVITFNWKQLSFVHNFLHEQYFTHNWAYFIAWYGVFVFYPIIFSPSHFPLSLIIFPLPHLPHLPSTCAYFPKLSLACSFIFTCICNIIIVKPHVICPNSYSFNMNIIHMKGCMPIH